MSMKRIALFPGSFDPFTKGHEDIVLRGLEIFDEIIQIDEDAKICLVHDTFDEDYNNWFKRYPKNLITSRQLLNKEDFSDSILKNEKDDILRTFIDLLILMQTKASIIANSSTFSGFASNWKQETVKNFEILDIEALFKK